MDAFEVERAAIDIDYFFQQSLGLGHLPGYGCSGLLSDWAETA
ncbi:hypothetical protein [Spirosoma pulveris]